jgi:hypothetical protein
VGRNKTKNILFMGYKTECKADIPLDVPTKRVLYQHSRINLADAEQVLDSKMRIRFGKSAA